MKTKRFTQQQICKQEKPIENEDSFSLNKGKRLVGEKETNESHQVGNILLKISKQEETIFNLSEQLISILTQYEVLNEELDQLKTLLVTNKHITREQIRLQSQQPSSQVVSMQIENSEYQQSLSQIQQQYIASTQEDKNKGISERLEKIERILIKRQKSKQSEKDVDIANLMTLNQKLQRLQKSSNKRKKNAKTDLKTLNNKRWNLQEKIFQWQNLERELVGQPSQQKKSQNPATQNLMGRPNQAEIPEEGNHLY